MKKLFLFSLGVLAALAMSGCGTKDNKNEGEHYPTYDTTSTMENINNGSPDSSSSNEKSNSGDMH